MPRFPFNLERSTIAKAMRGQEHEPQVIEYDQYVADHVRSTGRAVQSADIATSLLTLAAGWILLILASSAAEHWLTEHGFTPATRYGIFAVAAAATLWHLWVSLIPSVLGRINPLYAAHAIESSSPSLKNSVVNLLMLRRAREVPPAVLATLQKQAAERIAAAPEHAVVDRSRLVKLAGLLVVLLAVLLGYALVSAKSPLTTAARIAAPWADIAPPSRVRITRVSPGDISLVEGQTLEVEARVEGLVADERAWLVLDSEDGQYVNHRTPLAYDEDLDLHVATIATAGSRSGPVLSGDTTYHVEAGDGHSLFYKAKVLPAPTLVVEAVDYQFPAYTGMLDYSQTDTADVRGIEGTRVTLHAQANSPIESASIDFEGDGSYDLAMKVDPVKQTANASFTLALRRDRSTPKNTSYVLRFKTPDGLTNAQPAKHQIDVYPDYPPEVALTLPEAQELAVALNEAIIIAGEARDPDFALADFRLIATCDRQRVVNERLLRRPVRGAFDAEFSLTPSRYGLQVGDRVEYWLEATDNRRPDPQTAATHKQTLVVTSPQPRDAGGDQVADARDQQQPQGQEDAQQDQQKDPQQDAGNQQGGGQGGQDTQGEPGQGSQDGTEGGQQDTTDPPGEPGDEPQQGAAAGGQQTEGEQQNGAQDQAGGASGSGEQDPGSEPSSDPENPGAAAGDSGDPNDNNRGNQRGTGGGQGSGGKTAEPDGRGGQSSPGDRGDATRKPAGTPSSDMPSQDAPIDSDGADDGEAFDRILDHLKNDQPGGGQAAPQRRPGDPPAGDAPSGGRGAETTGGDTGDSQQQHAGNERDAQSDGGRQQSPRGDASEPGAEGQPQGSPTTDQHQRPTEKPQPEGGPTESDNDQARSPSTSRQESTAQGDQSGEQSGAGAEGGGQRAPRQGTGSSGQNEPSDNGGGQAGERGAGESGDQPGADQAADQPNGRAGENAGEGSTQRTSQEDGSKGQRPNGEDAMGNQQGPQSTAAGEDGQPSTPPGRQEQRPAEQQGDGAEQQPADTPAQQPQTDGESAKPPLGRQDPGAPGGSNARASAGGDFGGDQANLDYAREQMELVLDRLSDQLEDQQVDEQLLDRLGWTEDELRRFVERWRSRKAAAAAPAAGEAAKARLDKALRQLGPRRRDLNAETRRTTDEVRNQASGRTGSIPQQYRQRVQRYNQGVSGAGE